MNKPPYILIEGIDGAGKSRLSALLCDWLREEMGLPVRRTAEPWGKEAKHRVVNEELSNDEALQLFLVDRHKHMSSVVIPALQKGNAVVQDRGIYSTLVYQGFLGNGNIPAIEQKCFEAMGEYWPTATLWLDCPIEVAARRIELRDNRTVNYEERKELAVLHAGYNYYAGRTNLPRLTRIDASGDVSSTKANAIATLASILKPQLTTAG